MNNYCVYTHNRPSGDIFYVGKGLSYRPWRTDNRSKWWHSIVNKDGSYDVRIINDEMSNDEAIELEIFLIAELREHGVKLCNLTDGGDGVSGFKFSEESRERMKISNRGKARKGHKLTPEHIEKLREAKIGIKLSKAHCDALSKAMKGRAVSTETRAKIAKSNTGKKHTELTKKRLSKPVICTTTGEYFESVKAACKKHNLHRQNIAKVCSGRLYETGGLRFEYAKKELTT